MKKKKKQQIILVIAVIVIGILVSYYYSAEQTRNRGFNFGNELQIIQDDLKSLQTDFDSKYTIWKEGDISKEEFLKFSETHLNRMEELVSRYDALSPPGDFTVSVELFELSTQIQIQSDKHAIEWVKTGDEGEKIRSEELLQESFEYELAALEQFNAAKVGSNP